MCSVPVCVAGAALDPHPPCHDRRAAPTREPAVHDAATSDRPRSTASPPEPDVPPTTTPPATPRELLAAHDAVLTAVDDLTATDLSAIDPAPTPAALLGARTAHLTVSTATMLVRREPSLRPARLPRPRLLLRLFAVEHVRRVLDVLHRRLLADAAAGDDDAAERDAVERYLRSLPAPRRTAQVTLLVVSTFVILRVALLVVPGAARWFGGTGTVAEATVISGLLTALEQVARNMSSFEGLIEELAAAPLSTIAFVATSVATVLWLELRPFLPGFRLHRALWNLSGTTVDVPDGSPRSPGVRPVTERLRAVPASWHLQRTDGLYADERRVLRTAGAAAPAEPAFDLLVSALALPSLLFLAGLLIAAGRASRVLDASEPLLSYSLAAAVTAGVAARSWWLLRAWLCRQGARRSSVGDHRRITDTSLVVRRRSPWSLAIGSLVATACCAGVGIATAAAYDASLAIEMAGLGEATLPVTPFAATRFLAAPFVLAPIWFLLTRDLAAYRTVRHDGGWHTRAQPVVATAVIALGALVTAFTESWVIVVLGITVVAVSAAHTAWHIERLSRNIDGGPPPDRRWFESPAAVVVLFLIAFPLALAALQRALNELWRRDGHALTDEEPPVDRR
jgi:hypothetical protein